jgi:hypothetical protein
MDVETYARFDHHENKIQNDTNRKSRIGSRQSWCGMMMVVPHLYFKGKAQNASLTTVFQKIRTCCNLATQKISRLATSLRKIRLEVQHSFMKTAAPL